MTAEAIVLRDICDRRSTSGLKIVSLSVALVPLKLATYFAIIQHVIALVPYAAPLNMT